MNKELPRYIKCAFCDSMAEKATYKVSALSEEVVYTCPVCHAKTAKARYLKGYLHK